MSTHTHTQHTQGGIWRLQTPVMGVITEDMTLFPLP